MAATMLLHAGMAVDRLLFVQKMQLRRPFICHCWLQPTHLPFTHPFITKAAYEKTEQREQQQLRQQDAAGRS